MRQLQPLLLAVVMASAVPGFAQGQDWMPITPQDLQVKEVPDQAGAAAIQLYYSDQIDDRYRREYKVTATSVPVDKIGDLKRFFGEILTDEKNFAVLKKAN